MYCNIVTNKHNIGNVSWSDFEKTIHEYMKESITKFNDFSIVDRCKLNDEEISISVSSEERFAPLHKFNNGGWFSFRYCKSKKLRDYIFHLAILMDIILYPSSIISNVTITLFSNYK